jgi:signal transduction histidine kinase
VRVRLSTSFALVVVFALLAAVALALSFHVSSTALHAMVDQRELDKVKTIGRQVNASLSGQVKLVSQTARLTVSRGALARAVRDGTRGGEAVRRVLDNTRQISGLDLVEVIDSTEKVLYRAYDPEHKGDVMDVWGVYEALQGTGVLTTSVDDGVVVLRAIEPIRVDGRIVGALSVGIRLGDRLLQDIGAEVGAGLAMLGPSGQILATSGLASVVVEQAAVEQSFAQKIPVFRHDNRDKKTQAYLPVNIVDSAYVVVVEIDSSPAYREFAGANRQAAILTLGILMASILVGVFLLRWLMRPLRDLRKRAERIAVDLTGTPVRATSGSEMGAIVQVLDNVATGLLARNAELAEAKQAADAASQAKSQFLSNMSHEIRTPMNAILGLSSLLRHAGISSEQEALLGKIEDAGQHLLGVINNILDLSKIEAGRLSLQSEDFLVSKLLDAVSAVIGDAARGKGLNFQVEVSALPPALHGDVTRLRQCLLNYLGNAVKFTEQGGIMLQAEIVDSTGEGLLVRFVVGDTGPGLSPEQKSRVFDAFEQADNSTTRQYGGTGLGLTIVKWLAGLMGGDAGVDSVVGQGSSFWFTARLQVVDVQSLQVEADSRESAEALLKRDFAGRRILLVEDDPVNREIVEAFLQRVNLSVDVAVDGLLAVQAITATHYDLILMDMLMPNMDGLQATREIRCLPNGAEVPIVALTANAFAEDKQKCAAAGMDDFIAKPVSPESLYQSLIRWLS